MIKGLLVALCAFAFSSVAFATDTSDSLNLSTFGKPICPAHYALNGDSCLVDADAIKTLTTADKCSGEGIVFTAGPPATCTAIKTAPTPACKDLPGYSAKLASGACSYVKDGIGSSSSGDYIGDCFQIRTKIPGSGLLPTHDYIATDQKKVDNDDRQLTLVDAHGYALSCAVTPGGDSYQITASKLTAAGAFRLGWTYGVLSMPYKYYPSTKTFTTSLPIGAYVGFRRGQVGNGWTGALAFTLSSVRANTVDPTAPADNKPKVTGSTDTPALSLAAGVMFDIWKAPGAKPFKAGLFVGQDRVSRSPTVSYQQDGKWWFALQVGYDFTDN